VQKPSKFHDIYLATGLKKDYLSEQETFERVHATSSSIKKLNASQISPTLLANPNSLSLDAYSFKDSDAFYFRTIDLLYKRSRITTDFSVAADVGLMNFGQGDVADYKGIRYGGTLFYRNFSLRLGLNTFENFSEFVPTLKYNNRYKDHSYNLEYTRQNAIFYTYAIKSYEKRIDANHFRFSDNVSFENQTELWFGVEYNMYTNSDNELTGDFNWMFYKDTAFTPKFTYTLNLEGWYTSHSKQHADFYSPNFADSTLIRFDPQYLFSKYFGLRGAYGVGYSFSDEAVPYKYGLWAFGEPMKNMEYELGCHYSNAARIAVGGNYHYEECTAHLGYSW